MASIEQQLSMLETEINALKTAYEQTATSLPVFTTSTNFTTSRNTLVSTFGSTSRTENGIERIIVTFDTENGANTLATLELSSNNSQSAPNIRRALYKGGARWVITNQPKVDSGSWQSGNWQPTTYHIQIQSLVKGHITVEDMIS